MTSKSKKPEHDEQDEQEQQEQQATSENKAELMNRDAISAELLEKQGFLVPNEAWGATTGSEFMVTPEKLQKMDTYAGVDYLGMGCERGPFLHPPPFSVALHPASLARLGLMPRCHRLACHSAMQVRPRAWQS
jgi:hypothetical protein